MNYDNIFPLNCFRLKCVCLPTTYSIWRLSFCNRIGDIRFFFHSFIVWHCANQPYFDWAERLKQNMRETHTLKLKWNETKRNEMGWNEMKCVYTRLIILYHSDHNLWKFVFVFFSIYFVRSFVVFFGQCKTKEQMKVVVFLWLRCYCCHCRQQ